MCDVILGPGVWRAMSPHSIRGIATLDTTTCPVLQLLAAATPGYDGRRAPKKLDEFLANIPDEPQSPGYTDTRRAVSNSLLDMVQTS